MNPSQRIPLTPGTPLRIETKRCLVQRFPAASCDQCVQHCPTKALTLEAKGPQVSRACLQCGRCCAACPTHALSLQGTNILMHAKATDAHLYLECLKVPTRFLRPHTVSLPCLGALRASELLSLLRYRTGNVSIVERGFCIQCSAYTAGCAVKAVYTQVRNWLEQLGIPAVNRLHWLHAPLPMRMMQKFDGAVSLCAPVSRRSLWQTLKTHIHTSLADTKQPATTTAPVEHNDSAKHIHPLERLRSMAHLRALNPSRHTVLPSQFFAHIHITEHCNHCELCTRLCPTSALGSYVKDHNTGLVFYPLYCMACMACVRHCPQQALHWHSPASYGTKTQYYHSIILTRHRQACCAQCQRPFAVVHATKTPAAWDTLSLCPTCTQSQHLAQQGAHTLFGVRHLAMHNKPSMTQ